MKKLLTLLCLCCLCIGNAFADEVIILQEDFSSITTGNSTATGGSSTSWGGNENFPSNNNSSAYQAGGSVRLGGSKAIGYLTSKTIDLSGNGGNFIVEFDAKGWSSIEGQIKVTPTGCTSQTSNITSIMSEDFEHVVMNFTGGKSNSTIKFETTAKRAFIDNIKIYYTTTTKTLSSIAVSGTPTKTTYEAGEEFDPAGLVVTGTYDDESEETITEDITWNVTPSPLTTETTSVSVVAKVGEIESDPFVVNGFTVTAAKTLIGIEATGTPAEFWKGDAFNHNGITVTALWDDETETDVTSLCDFSGYDMSVAGNQTVTVTYQGETDTYEITVNTIANTQETAYTVAQAKELIDAGKDLATEVYVKGKISQIDSYNSTYKSITYWISEDGTTTNQFEVYGGLKSKDNGNGSFVSKNDIDLQADVIVCGIIKKFNTTYEFDKNNYLVSYSSSAKKYTIEIDSDIENGAVESDAVEAAAGVEVTLTVIPADGYKLSSLTVTDATGAPVTVTNNEFTMPASNVTVSATFSPLATYTITWMANDAQFATTQVVEGDALALPETNPADVDGYTFCGWIANDSYSSETTAPEYIVPANIIPTGSATYYAVFAQATGGGESTSVTKDIIEEANPTSSVTLNNDNNPYQIGNLPITLTGIKGTNNFPAINVNTTKGNDLRFYNGTTGGVTFATTNGQPITKIEFLKNEETASELGTSFSVNVGTLAGNVWTGSAESVTISYNNSTNYKEQMYIVNVTYSEVPEITYSDYCTTVEVPQASIECAELIELASTESGLVPFSVTLTAIDDMDVYLFSDAECTQDITETCDWFDAQFNDASLNVDYYALANPLHTTRTVYMQLFALDSEANEITKVVTVTQAAAQPSTVYASLAELVAAGEPTTDGRDITLTLNDDEITSLTSTSSSRTGIILKAESGREIFVHSNTYGDDITERFNTGGFVSGTVTGIWKKDYITNNNQWVLQLDLAQFDNLSCAYPITIKKSGRGTAEARVTSEGGEAYDTPATKINAGAAAGILMTPMDGWHFNSIASVEITSIIQIEDYQEYGKAVYFIMPAQPVTVTVAFGQEEVDGANVIMTWADGTVESFKVEENGTVTLKETDETIGKLTKIEINENIENVNVSYTRSFSTTNWQAWYVPFDLTITQDLYDNFEFGEIWDTKVENDGRVSQIEYVLAHVGDVIPANTPYFVRAKTAKAYTFTSTGTLYETTSQSIDCSTTKCYYTFTGIYQQKKNLQTAGCWILSDGVLNYLTNDETALQPYRFYMLVTDKKTKDVVMPSGSSEIKLHNAFGDDDFADAIDFVESNGESKIDVYSVTGALVKKQVEGANAFEGLSRGVYLVNGKKVLVK